MSSPKQRTHRSDSDLSFDGRPRSASLNRKQLDKYKKSFGKFEKDQGLIKSTSVIHALLS